MGMKRMVYLFCLALLIGMVLVHFRTRHMQAVFSMVQLTEQEQQLRQELWNQQMRLSGALESPQRIKQRIADLQVSVYPPDAEEEESAVQN